MPATAPDAAVADAIVLSPTVASNPAKELAVSTAPSAVCRASIEVVNVPHADTCESAEFDSVLIWSCWPAPNAVVSADTIPEILRPDPIPVEVTSELPVEFADDEDDVEPVEVPVEVVPVEVVPVDVVVVGVDVVLEMVELMSLYVLSQVANLSAAGT